MSFLSCLKELDKELLLMNETKRKINVIECIESSSNKTYDNKLYKCPVCRSRFFHLTSFIITCRKHWLKVEKDSNSVKSLSRRGVAKLPKGHVYYCKLCKKDIHS